MSKKRRAEEYARQDGHKYDSVHSVIPTSALPLRTTIGPALSRVKVGPSLRNYNLALLSILPFLLKTCAWTAHIVRRISSIVWAGTLSPFPLAMLMLHLKSFQRGIVSTFGGGRASRRQGAPCT